MAVKSLPEMTVARSDRGPHPRRWTGAAILAATGALLVTGTASAQTAQFTFTGRGFGHGVGMSQYGAEGYAVHGYSAASIIGHYFQHTSLASVSQSTPIRVLIASGQTQVAIGVVGSASLVNAATGAVIVASLGAGTYTVTLKGTTATVTGAGIPANTAAAAVDFASVGANSLVTLLGNSYRGTMRVAVSGGRLAEINSLPIETYVRGVISWEMPSSWNPVALQAQAIASRSYGLGERSASTALNAYDVHAGTVSQMYGGASAETTTTNAAVAATAGQAVTYGGRVVPTPFFSASGGYTESAVNVWGGNDPWLIGVPDPYESSPMDPWPSKWSYTGAALAQALGIGGTVAKIQILSSGVSPRVMTARIIRTNGTSVVLSGNTIAADLNLPSTWFTVTQPVAPSPVAATVRTQIAIYVVTHYPVSAWRHEGALLAARAASNPTAIARLVARNASAHLTSRQVRAFVAAHYAPRLRARITRRILVLPPASQIALLARTVF